MNITLYRKYRPQNFNEIAGQEFVTRAIKNSLKENKLSHAYLFTGPRGVGKTTIARLIAKGVNCLNNGISDSPCGICENCVEIAQGISMDMIEIDAASNRGIGEIRELKEKINYQPVKGKRKIYIIDEVHMLTKEAFNALLKTLEEPPGHVIFILATTEIDKIPDTVVSRCQRYDFLPIEKEDIKRLLKNTASKENINIDDESLDLIYRKSEGSARDSFSIFEQVISNFGSENIDLEKTQKALGIVPDIILNDFLGLIKKGVKEELIEFIDKIWETGIVIETFLKDFAYYLKEQFKKDRELSVDFVLNTIGSIFFILNEFKYEEDKRLLGYVLIYELYKKRADSHMKNEYREENMSKNKSDTGVKKREDTYGINLNRASESSRSRNTEDNTGNKRAKEDENLDFSLFQDKWKEIRAEIKSSSVIIEALMWGSYPDRLEDSTLVIMFPPGNKFHRDGIMTSDKKLEVEKIINRICDSNIQIKGEVENSEKKTSEDELVNKTIKFFDAEIVERR